MCGHAQTEDGRNIRGPSQHPAPREEHYARRNELHEDRQFVWPQRTEVEVGNMVQDAFARVDAIHEEMTAENDGDLVDMMADLEQESMDLNVSDMEQLIRESTEVLYEGCAINRLQAAIVLLNMANLYAIPNTFMDELLSFVATDLLPQSNCLPRSTYEMKRMIMRMGL